MKKALGWIAVGLMLVVFGSVWNYYSPTAQTSKAIALELKPQCDALAAKYGKTCQSVIVVIK